MHFGKVVINNFMAIGQATLDLQNRGLLLIQGDNQEDGSQDSNGAGKSTVADAISWCLFGVTARGVSPNDVVNRTAKKNCSVELPIYDGDNEYLVARYRKDKEFKNSVQLYQRVNGELVSLTQGTDKLTQDRIEQILGCTHEIFSASVYSAQEAQVDLPAMTDKQLKSIVEEAAGINRLQKAEVIARERLRDKKQAVVAAAQARDGWVYNVDKSKDQLAGLVLQSEQFEKSFGEKVKGVEARVKEAEARVKKAVASLERVDVDAINKQITEIKANEDKLQRDHSDRVFEAQGKHYAAKSKVDKISNDLQALATQARKLDGQCKAAESLIGTQCGECGKGYEEHDMDDAIATRKKRLAEVMTEITQRKPLLLKAREEQEQTLAEQQRIAGEKPESAIHLTSELLRKKSDYQNSVAEIRAMKGQYDNLVQELGRVREETNPYTGLIESAKLKLEAEQGKLEQAQLNIAATEKAFQVAEAVAQVYGRTGVRAHILDTVTPYLNERTANYLAQLSDGNIVANWQTLSTKADGELAEKFCIDVSSKTGGESFKALSGGEKRKVRLSTNLALQDLVSTRATKNIELYIGDEIDHALDTAGLERLMGVLDERARSHGTVVVISHNELRDWIRQQVTVVKKDGYATLVE